MEKFKELLFLKQLKGIGKSAIYTRYYELLKKMGSFDELLAYVKSHETKLTGADVDEARDRCEASYIKIMDNLDIEIITVFDENYPKRLHVMGNSRPLILYAKGNIDSLEKPNIAVVGTRKPSNWSMTVEERLVKKIIDLSGRVVVSGLALGCDKIAHETTVKQKHVTIAVLPSGFNNIMPARHKTLAKEILANNGCLLTEYEPDAMAFTSQYLERDSLVAALSDCTFVIECNIKGGTMSTVNAAIKYKKKLACYYPNDTTKGSYEGNDYIIGEHGARMVGDTKALIQLLQELEDSVEYREEKEEEPHQLTLEELFMASFK